MVLALVEPVNVSVHCVTTQFAASTLVLAAKKPLTLAVFKEFGELVD